MKLEIYLRRFWDLQSGIPKRFFSAETTEYIWYGKSGDLREHIDQKKFLLLDCTVLKIVNNKVCFRNRSINEQLVESIEKNIWFCFQLTIISWQCDKNSRLTGNLTLQKRKYLHSVYNCYIYRVSAKAKVISLQVYQYEASNSIVKVKTLFKKSL